MKFVNGGRGKGGPHYITFWLARLSGIVMILPASMAVGGMLGYFVADRYLTSFPWGTIVFTLFGAGAGFYEIVKILTPSRGKEDRTSDGNG